MIQRIVEQAVEAYRRKVFWEKANVAFAKLREDEEGWREELEERRVWNATLTDGR